MGGKEDGMWCGVMGRDQLGVRQHRDVGRDVRAEQPLRRGVGGALAVGPVLLAARDERGVLRRAGEAQLP